MWHKLGGLILFIVKSQLYMHLQALSVVFLILKEMPGNDIGKNRKPVPPLNT